MGEKRLAKIVLDVMDDGSGDFAVHHEIQWSKELGSTIDTMDQSEKRVAVDHRTEMMKSAVNLVMTVKHPGEQHASVSEREFSKSRLI